jgi:hypothetical protein
MFDASATFESMGPPAKNRHTLYNQVDTSQTRQAFTLPQPYAPHPFESIAGTTVNRF